MSTVAKIMKPGIREKITIKRRKICRDNSYHQKESAALTNQSSQKIILKNSTHEFKPVRMTFTTTHKKSSKSIQSSFMRKRLSRNISTSNQSLAQIVSPAKPAKVDFPIKPKEALILYSHELTGYEQAEILDYSEVYYLGNKSTKVIPKLDQSNFGFDDQQSNLRVSKGDHLAFRYEVLSLLGKGSFGQVCECFDHKRLEKVAIKIIRNKSRFYNQAGIEVSILSALREGDLNDTQPVIKMKNYFLYRKHICISFDLWNHNLYELMKGNKFQGMSVGLIKKFAVQILTGLSYLTDLEVIHCDLKPENILLRHPTKSDIVLIDFGSATFYNEKIHTYIQSRFYRAPEIILGISYTTAIDMWSLGCILCELYTGSPLFPGESEHDQLVYIMEMFGYPSDDMMQKSTKKDLFFEGKELKDKRVKGRSLKIPGSRKLSEVISSDDKEFVDFVSGCLVMEPCIRLTAKDGLNHPWIVNYVKPAKFRSSLSYLEKRHGKVKMIVE